jgi:hypothetical protein
MLPSSKSLLGLSSVSDGVFVYNDSNLTKVMSNISNKTSLQEAQRNTLADNFVVLGILTIPIVLLGFIGALLFLYKLKKDSKQRRSVKALFVNLCVSTMVFCIFSGPFQALTYITQNNNFLASPTNDAICQINAFMNVATIYIVVLCHAAIAANRYFVIVFHDRPTIQNSKSLLIILLTSPWLITVLITIFPFFQLGGTYGYSELVHKCSFLKRDKFFLFACRIISAGFALTVIFCSYFAICLKVTRRTRQRFSVLYRQSNVVLDTSTLPQSSLATLRRMRKEVRVARSTFITCLAFVVCFLPATIHAFTVKNPTDLQGTFGMTLILLQWIGNFILFEASEKP